MRIEKLVYGGTGLAREQGKVVLVPFVLPGEEVSVEAVADRKDLTHARLQEVLSPSPDRVAPPCPHFSRCGGCHFQHTGYAFQLAQKVEILRDVLRRVGKLEPPADIDIVAGEPWGYRNRIQLHLVDGNVGFLEAGSEKLCAVGHCPIASPKLNDSLAALRRMARERRFPSFVRTVELFTNESEVQLNILATAGDRRVARTFFDWAAQEIPGLVSGSFEYFAAGEQFRVGHRSFFQVNRFLIEPLAAAALDGAEGERAFDLYAGVGLFSLPLARRFRHVAAVESGASALNDLEHNTVRAGLAIATVRHAVDLFLEAVSQPPDFVLADPPRAGLGKSVVKQLVRLHPPRLTLVACDPATLARDLAALLGSGYTIRKMLLVDLFPQTYHLESVVHLELAG